VFVAVPVWQMHAVLSDLRPHLRADQHLVMDVGSVKLRPAEWMAEIIGDAIPWLATHPLFGPNSVARGEPLRVILCANPSHPEAEERAASLYATIGCRIIRQDAETHDRTMAESHALAFFVAKGMLDAGVDVENQHTPPSFQAMRTAIDAVRGDAGHLLLTLHRQNPFARAARQRFLEALRALHELLLEYEAEVEIPVGPPAKLTIPLTDELKETRAHIDELDEELVALLARRAQLSRRAGRAKAGRAVRDPQREKALIETRRAWAEAAGIEADDVEAVFQAVLHMSRRLQSQR
jgi:prephenate dehydrogenase